MQTQATEWNYENIPSPLIQAAVTDMKFQNRHRVNPAKQNYKWECFLQSNEQIFGTQYTDSRFGKKTISIWSHLYLILLNQGFKYWLLLIHTTNIRSDFKISNMIRDP